MKVQPVGRYQLPRYPTRDILDDHPALLRALPNRWRQSAVVLAALSATAALVTGCRQQAAQAAEEKEVAPPAPAVHLVAPIFQHGNGQGAFGCVAVNPPVFLSEEEARQVVLEESKRVGIAFTPDGRTFEQFPVPVTRQEYAGDKKTYLPAVQTAQLVLDGMDAKRGIGFEYVSETDFAAWRAKDNGMMSTAWSENLLAPARQLRDELEKVKPAGAYGVFYDPMVGMNRTVPPGPPSAFSDTTLTPVMPLQWMLELRVDYAAKTGLVTLTGKTRTVKFTVGSATASVDGKAVALPCKVRERNGMPYVPLQWTVQHFGGATQWNAREQCVSIQVPGKPRAQSTDVQAITFPGEKTPVSVANAGSDWMTQQALAKDNAREELRKQVHDFITWLKAEGVI